jgi:hypothetical protein
MPTNDPLREIPRVSQVRGEPSRRWFYSARMELILWLDEQRQPYGFQLCYDIGGRERAITWTPHHGYRHDWVDGEGNRNSRYKGTPVLRPARDFDRGKVLQDFTEAAGALPPPLRQWVCEALGAWPGESPAGRTP